MGSDRPGRVKGCIMNVDRTAVRKVMAPTDFSDHSRRVIEFAAAEAALREAELHLFHCVMTQMVGHPIDGTAIPVAGDLVKESERCLEKLSQAIEKTHSTVPSVEIVRAVAHGTPEQKVVEYAREHQIELIVMGSHARSGVERLLMGSTAELILRHAPCPVLIVPPAGNE